MILAAGGDPAVNGHPLFLYGLFHDDSFPNRLANYLKVTVTAFSAVMVIYLIA